jgi:hypothetical protein
VLGLSCSNWGFQEHTPIAHHGDAVHGDPLVPDGDDEDGADIPEDEDEDEDDLDFDFNVEDLQLATVHEIIDELAEKLRPHGEPLGGAQAIKVAEDNVAVVFAKVNVILHDAYDPEISSEDDIQQWMREALTKTAAPVNVPRAGDLKLSDPSCTAERLFNHIIRRAFSWSPLRDPDYKPYHDFLLDHATGSRLFQIVKGAIHDDVWVNFVEGDKAFDPAFFQQFQSAPLTNDAGWYLIFLVDIYTAWGKYVGQSVKLRTRLTHHLNAAKKGENKSKLYEFWRGPHFVPGQQPQSTAKFIPLGIEPPIFAQDAQLHRKFSNIVETFLSVVFQTLCRADLEDWTDKSVGVPPGDHGLNTRVPIAEQTSRDFMARVVRQVGDARARAIRHAARNRYWKAGVFRDADPTRGEPESLVIRCDSCGAVRPDPKPAIISYTGQYVTPKSKCRCGRYPTWTPVGSVLNPKDVVRYGAMHARFARKQRLLWEHTPVHLRSQTPPAADVISIRGRHFEAGILRFADPTMGEPESVKLQCVHCGALDRDDTPIFVNHTKEYVVSLKRCCKGNNGLWIPDGVPNGFVRRTTFLQRIKNPARYFEYTPHDRRGHLTAPVSKSPRDKALELGIIRYADPTMGDPTSVKLVCRGCGAEQQDAKPIFIVHTQQYVIPKLGCSASNCKERRFTAADIPKDKFMLGTSFNTLLRNPLKAWEYTPDHLRGPKPAPAEKPAKKSAKTPAKPATKKPATKKRLSSSRDDDDDDDEVPRKKR